MKLSFWVDVFPWTRPEGMFPTPQPVWPKPSGAIRYRVDAEIPDWRGEDTVVQAGVVQESNGQVPDPSVKPPKYEVVTEGYDPAKVRKDT
jgi:hypothetical protein